MKKILTVVGDTLYLLLMFAAAIAVVTITVVLFTPPASAQESKLLDPTNDPWESVLQIKVVEDEWGCQIQTGWSQQYFVYVERYVCPQYMDEFYARMSSAQRRKALEEGIKLLNPGFREKYPDLWEEVALNKFFRTIKENGQG